ncbi:MAG: hydrogenase formation protein HypD [Gammaproteobacteria bacterium HGW-Gammaproteobacteria-4]|jgi:hydrogenase expression/formation protein HypD|nr:MAG: hydrogenase formation protein HypD [Gammaproteobacteria bacterium HGW-Gammaproteobacteria-4]PKP68356.1 MAG: hydrogenase formation protein HypD [Alphaproteobacteria bacterium HGW-Alphaproteobacteria-5]
MKYIDAFRDGATGRGLAARIAAEVNPARSYRLMEFCGGHTHAIFRYGVQDLLPANVIMVHGPGCPVCVLPVGRLDMAIELARRPEVILCSYGDMLRIPGSRKRSLLRARAEGADVRMISSTMDALALAEAHPDRQVVFLAIGFETTTPPTAAALRVARARGIGNFSILCNHVLTPAAISNILQAPALRDIDAVQIDGFLGPAHVSVVIGSQPYEYFAEEFARPVVISGFEPLDVMQSILMLVRQINDGRAEVENQYQRAVSRHGNATAKALVADVFELRRSFEWRGLGTVPYSALKLRAAYADFDAEQRFAIAYRPTPENRACACPRILRGAARPTDCVLFGKQCTPQTPLGSCMVSDEGACAAYYKYGRHRAEVTS